MNIGFWNIKNNAEIYDTIIELIKGYDIDILLLAECPGGIFTNLIKHPAFYRFKQVSNGDSNVEIYSRVFTGYFNRPNTIEYSDHYPILLNLNI